MPTFARVDLAFERGEGVWLIATNGERYLDFCSGVAVNALGHSHPQLVAALEEQARKVWHVSNLYEIPEGERAAKRLCEASFADYVFFCNSGAEAMECAIKVARKYQSASGKPERYRIIAFEGSFHGRTLATLSAAGNEKYLKGYAPNVEGFEQVPFGNLNEVRGRITPETAAILIEPVQGEGGMRAANAQFLKDLRTVCDEFGLLLMFDEVQCGMGRTGKLFAHEWAGVTPDLMSTAKAIGGGFPLGACLATSKVAAAFGHGAHGSTFGGNPLAMAIGNAVLDVMLAPGFLDNVAKLGRQLDKRLGDLVKRFPKVFVEVRGLGLIRGLKCAGSNAEVVDQARAKGLLLVSAADNVVRLLPPLIISEAELDQGIDLLAEIAAQAKAA